MMMMMMYTCSVCRGKTLTTTQSIARFDIGSVRKAGGAVASPLNYLGTAEINTPVGVESAPCSNRKITKSTMGINVQKYVPIAESLKDNGIINKLNYQHHYS